MAKPNKPKKSTAARRSYGDDQEPQPNPEAESDVVGRHREYVERRLEGGALATPQAYARAMAQWQRLPGAIPSLPATDLQQAQEEPPPNDERTPTPASDTRDEDQAP